MTPPLGAQIHACAQTERTAETLLGTREHHLRRVVREVVQREVAPRARVVDSEGAFPEASFRALADAGLTGLVFPSDFGGKDHSTLAYVVAMEEISAACGSTSLVYMTQTHCAYPIFVAGSNDQKQRFLPPLCEGRVYGSIAVTEPDAGSDVASISTTASRDGDRYVLNGAKSFVSNGDRASVLVVFATIDPQSGRDGITAFIVESRMAGVMPGRILSKMGMRGASTVELVLDGCELPVMNRLGQEREGYALLIRSVIQSRVSAAAQGLGIARGAYERALQWAKVSGLLSSDRNDAQDVQFAFADMRHRLAAARLLLYHTAALFDSSEGDVTAEVSMAKLHCTDLAMTLSEEAVDLLGEEGDLEDLEVERYLRDAKVTQIYDGTNQIQKVLIARSLWQLSDRGASASYELNSHDQVKHSPDELANRRGERSEDIGTGASPRGLE